ncbi:MAG: baseplate J/gp47 family protein [Lewinellaceae bacterium]|nr:baseplate J/gp47 family protein [Lewinellaceae bacterium]
MSWEVGHPIKRDGTNQLQRLLDALRPERHPVDGRGIEDLLLFISRMAEQVAYYNDGHRLDGDWLAFFSTLQDTNGVVTPDSIRQYLAGAEQRQDNGPFMTILLTFLRLYGYLQQDINTLTQKHLEFYYQQVLGFRRLPAHPDEVHVHFELAPHAGPCLLPAGTALKAGNDADGKPLLYVTNRDIVVGKARLAAIKTHLLDNDGRLFAAEVANSADGLGAPLEGVWPKWPLFGAPDFMQPAAAGFAIASPLLQMAEGQRLINLTLTFADIPTGLTAADFGYFIPYASGTASWVKLAYRSERQLKIDRDTGQVRFFFALDTTEPAIAGYEQGKLAGNFPTTFPVLRLTLHPGSRAYPLLKELVLREVDISVSVLDEPGQPGVQKVVLQNDHGLLPTGGAFQPFGPTPAKNSRFYIGSSEVFSKPLRQLIIRLHWAGLPENSDGFEGYYAAYAGFKGKKNRNYTASLQVLAHGQWLASPDAHTTLFEPTEDADPVDHVDGKLVPDKELLFNHLSGLFPLNPEAVSVKAYDSSLKQGFIRLSLEQDFGHRIFPQLFALAAKGGSTGPPPPNPPYTPTLQSISIGYTASQTIAPGRDDSGHSRFFHLQPFGSSEPSADAGGVALLPDLPRAALYIGFSGLEPPENLHLLFQIAEGSAEAPDIVRAADIQWHYLTDQGWRATPLADSEILVDTTVGLQRPGIMAFQIGPDAGKNAAQMPRGLHWLRASLWEKDPAAAARAMAIVPQAVTAVFRNEANDPGHLLQPLPAGTITGLLERNSAIRKVEQPYNSFNGAPAEQDNHFYTRVSERLRHKQRAVTLWDIERLTLQRFPALYEVKAIPHTGVNENGFYSEFLPGQVTVVLVPQLRNRNAVNRLRPKVSAALLEEVRTYLQSLSMSFTTAAGNTLHVVHPRYEPIRLSFSVAFHSGYDAGYYAGVLQETLIRRLSPWAFDEGVDIRFGGRIYKSQLLAFVEEQEYVDYVTDFKMFREQTGPGVGEMSVDIDLFVRAGDQAQDTDVAEASTATAILVSASEHRIQVLSPGAYPCTEPGDLCEGGIDCWFIDIDFMVSA